jgi:splicing factor 45
MPSEDERPAKRPKLSKAEAMMAKMGYVKGQGLGKDGDGVTTPLEVKIRKGQPPGRKVATNDDDYLESSKNVKSQQVYDILGGVSTKRKEPDRFGEVSKVVIAWGCVNGVDLAADADLDDGGIKQEMGQVFSQKVRAYICCWIYK